ncbi:MAG: hypothetical protein ACYSW3_00100 [Planctomycetota bacterium]|jgi:hypothetical protein
MENAGGAQLAAHKDTSRVSEAQVMAIPEPEFTKTWHPVSHARVITALDSACKEIGLGVINRQYSLNTSGTRMFGCWDLTEGNSKMGWSLGIRNAIDKSMVLGICAGVHVWICDNLAFMADFIAFHKHTSGLTPDKLAWLAEQAVHKALPMMEDMNRRQHAMESIYVWDKDLAWLAYEFQRQEVFAPSQFKNFHNALDEELALVAAGSRTLSAVYGAVTRLHRANNLFRVAGATARLQGCVDKYIDMRLDEGKYVPEELLN